MKSIGILGSTGSIGTQALQIIDKNINKYDISYLTCLNNYKLLSEQALYFRPKKVCIVDSSKEKQLSELLKNENIEVYSGVSGLHELSSFRTDLTLNAIVGSDGMIPTINALKNNIQVALANKESMVMAGWIINDILKENNRSIIPVDSEHSAIFQCLTGEKVSNVRRIILTGSGGPFRTKNYNEFKNIEKKEALNHPNWQMGKKISIDSATMMNKGLEFIEAYWLFNVPKEKIDIIVHPQSIIHSIVEFTDGSMKCQMGYPDMEVPIRYAFSYPGRSNSSSRLFNFLENDKLTFESPDYKKFPCIQLAQEALKSGYSHQVVLNVANDIAVLKFLNDKISFTDIPKVIDKAISSHVSIDNPSIDEILELSEWTKEFITNEVINV